MTFKRSLAIGGAVALLFTSAQAFAQGFASRPLVIVVPSSAGGILGTLAQPMANAMNALGHKTIVEFKPGATGIVGMQSVVHAPPDGKTVVLACTSMLSTNPALFKSLSYDPVRDFEPVTSVVSIPMVLLASKSSKANSFAEFVKLAKEPGNKLSYASAGTGSNGHLAMESLKTFVGGNLVHAPYKGLAPAFNDLLGGHVDYMWTDLPNSLEQINAGVLKPLAIAAGTRSAALPNVATMKELINFDYDASSSCGILAPAHTPKASVDELNTVFTKILNDPELKGRFTSLGMNVKTSNPDEFRKFIAAELPKWAAIVKSAGIEPE